MTSVSRLKTDAEQAIARAFQAALTGDHALDDVRAEAFAEFDVTGLPHRRIEAYKYTDLKALVRSFHPVAGQTSAQAMERFAKPAAGVMVLHIVDGIYRPELTGQLAPGVTVESLSTALAGGTIDLPGLRNGPQIAGGDPVLALNAALLTDGVVIAVSDDTTVAAPIHLVHTITSSTPVSVHTRSLVVLGKNASLGLIESYDAASAGHQRTDVLNLLVDDGGRLEHAVAKTDATSLDLATITAVIGADADVRSFALVTAGDVTRRQHFVRMAGNRSRLSLKGASLLNGRMHADTTLTVEHDSLDCESRELYRSVIDGAAHGVFQGKGSCARALRRPTERWPRTRCCCRKTPRWTTSPSLKSMPMMSPAAMAPPAARSTNDRSSISCLADCRGPPPKPF